MTTLDSLFMERHSAMVSYELGPHGQELAKQTLGKVFQKECIRVKSQRLSQGKAQSLVPKWWVKERVQQRVITESWMPRSEFCLGKGTKLHGLCSPEKPLS